MTVEALNKFSKLTRLLVLFYAVWITLLLIGFGLLIAMEEARVIVFVLLFPMAAISVLFTVHIARKMKRLSTKQ